MRKTKSKRKRINWKKIRWGTLTRWLKKHRRSIKRKYGDPFVVKGNEVVEINDRVLKKLEKDEKFVKRLSGSHWKKILRKIRFKLRVLRG